MMPNYYESSTPEDHVEVVKKAIEKMETDLTWVEAAWVDDWGRFSNFSTFVQVGTFRSYSGRANRGFDKLKVPNALEQIKKKLKDELKAQKPDVSFDVRLSDRRVGPCKVVYNIDIDFHKFDAASNTFPTLL